MEINALLAHCTALAHHALARSNTSFYCRHTGEFICDYQNVRFLPPQDELLAVSVLLQLLEQDPDIPYEVHEETALAIAAVSDDPNSIDYQTAYLLADYEGKPEQTAELKENWELLHGPGAKPDFKAIHYDYTLPAWEWSLGHLNRAVSDFIHELPPRQANKPASHQIDPAARGWDKTRTSKDGTIVRSLEDTRFVVNLENPFNDLAQWRWNDGQPYRLGDSRPNTPLITEQTPKETT